MYKLFAVTAPGIEFITERELISLGLRPPADTVTTTGGGVEFDGDLNALYTANLQLRTAHRVLIRLGNFRAVAFSELRKKASRLDWQNFLKPGQPVCIRATCHKSKLYHSGGVAERIAGAIEDSLGAAVNVVKPSDEDATNPPQLIVVRIAHDECTVSIDSSGELLHRRGYRQAIAKAPLRETLAAAMLIAADWDKTASLIDPFCGSGVIAIEAAMLAANIAPGAKRRFAFMDWRNFDKQRWQSIQTAAQTALPPNMPVICGSDRDTGAIEMARQNAERAGVAEFTKFECHAVSAIQAPSTSGWIVTNPPYGVRISADKDLRNLYAQFGNVLRKQFNGWHLAILCNEASLLQQTKLRYSTVWKTNNGGINVSLSRARITSNKP